MPQQRFEMTHTIHAYLKSLEKEMKLKGIFRAEMLEEIEVHLLDSFEANLLRGMKQTEAEKEALRRFGSIETILLSFEKEGLTTMQKVLIGVAAVMGIFSLYVETRPTWDDTGILVFGILLICGLLSLIGYQRPWLLALAVGAWIPLYRIIVSHSYASIIALVIAFIGAYAGWLIRAGINKIFSPA